MKVYVVTACEYWSNYRGELGARHLRFDDRKTLYKILEEIIPDWIGKDYSGGQEKEFEYD